MTVMLMLLSYAEYTALSEPQWFVMNTQENTSMPAISHLTTPDALLCQPCQQPVPVSEFTTQQE